MEQPSMSAQDLPSSKTEVLLRVKRIGIDKTWQVAPYSIKSVAGAERLAEWLKQSFPPFEYLVIS